jgi:GNAT superfamily N-acetyltransferase
MQIRPPVKEDVPFLMDSWLNSLRAEYPQLPDDIFFQCYRELVRRLLTTAQVRILEHEGSIVGYSVSWDAEGVLHWIYLKQKHRGKGLARQLLAHLPPYPQVTFRSRSRAKLQLGPLKEVLIRRLKSPSSTSSTRSESAPPRPPGSTA